MIYLACPYSDPDPAVREERFRAVTRAAGHLMGRGALVFSPITHSHPLAVQCGLPLDFEYWRRWDERLLKSCDELYILTLPGWGESRGVANEIRVAREWDIPIYYIAPATYAVSSDPGETREA